MKSKLITLIAALGALVGGAANAQSTWSYATFTEDTTNAGTFGNSWSQTQGGVKLTVSAYSNTNTGSTFATANVANFGTGSGFGVKNQVEGLNVATPQHSMDNFNTTDLLVLQFSSSVNITQIATGWHNADSTLKCMPTGGTTAVTCGTDSDVSLLRWTGTTGPTITGGTIASLLSAGWSLVNNYADMVDDTNRATGTTATSSWWIISAYNSAWGTGTNTANLSNGDDFLKVLSSVTATPTTKVPEPGSLALAAVALLGLGAARRARRS